LRSKTQFAALHSRGRRFSTQYFSAIIAENSLGHSRLGLAVSLKMAGSGVRRNMLRRLIRESFRLHQYQLPAVDLSVSARGNARAANNAVLQMSLHELWHKITHHWRMP
jgi:ribonuclease P protein component